VNTTNSKFVWKWALYDWANSAFATSILAGFLPIFFKQYWAADLSVSASTTLLGLGHTIIGLLVALSCLGIGILVNHYPIEKKVFSITVTLAIFSTASLAFVSENHWFWALVCFGLANIGFSTANTLYDAQLINECPPKDHTRISSLGYSLGYAGGGALLMFHFLIVIKPHWFGITDLSGLIKWVLLTVALWWGSFSLPLLVSPRSQKIIPKKGALNAILKNKSSSLFLIAFWFYMDGVWTIIKMAVDYGLSLGFSQTHLLAALLITQLIGFPATYLIQKCFKKKNPLHLLIGLLGIYLGISLVATTLQTSLHFYLLAASIGLVQGSVQALSRSFFGSLIEPEHTFAAFGIYNLVGKFSAILGPLLIVLTQTLLSPILSDTTLIIRLGISSIGILFVIGIGLLIHLNQKISYTYKKR